MPRGSRAGILLDAREKLARYRMASALTRRESRLSAGCRMIREPGARPGVHPMKRFLPALFFIALLFSCIHSTAQSRIAVPSYQSPGVSQWLEWRTVAAPSVGIMIVNLDNGDDTTYDPRVDQAIRNTRKQGIFVVGYVYTGYGQRDPALVRKKVDAVFHNYLVDG